MDDDGDRHVFFPEDEDGHPIIGGREVSDENSILDIWSGPEDEELDHKHGQFWLEKKEKKDQYNRSRLFFLNKDKLVQYVELMLKRWGMHENILNESERFEVARAVVVAGLQYDELHDLQGEAYAKALAKDIKKYDDAVLELAEWLAKYMRMRQIAGIA